MIPKYSYDLVVIAVILLIFYIFCLYQKKKKGNLENFTSPSPSSSQYRNSARLIEGQNPDVVNELKVKYIDYYTGDGTYKRLPLKKGTRQLSTQLDEGVLKKFRVNTYLNTDSIELNYTEMLKLLNTITRQKNYELILESKNLVLDNKLNLSFIHDKIAKHFIDLVNTKFQNLGLETIYNMGDSRKYQIFKKQIISDTEVEGLTTDNRILMVNISIYKPDKDYHYTFQLTCLYNFIQNVVGYEEINIIGIHENEKVAFDKFYPLDQEHCILDQPENPQINQNSYCHPKKLTEKNRNLSIFEEEFNKNELQDFFKAKKEEEKRHEDYQKYKCFDKTGFSRSTCESFSFEKGVYGVWDKPCEKNTDCPFFKSNRNYENQRGGCINGYCEMPVNVKRRGFQYYENTSPPFCHGCKRENCVGANCFTCCEEQARNKFKYPDLKSPDFMFVNDNR